MVDKFNYLGTIFKYTGNFSSNTEYIVGKAFKALNVLVVNCKKLPLKPKILCQLFDAFVGSVLLYTSEIWGVCLSMLGLLNIGVKLYSQIILLLKCYTSKGLGNLRTEMSTG